MDAFGDAEETDGFTHYLFCHSSQRYFLAIRMRGVSLSLHGIVSWSQQPFPFIGLKTSTE